MFFSFRINRKLTLLLITVAIVTLVVCSGAVSQANATNVKDGIKLPILMYHSMLMDQKYQGKYVISPDTFENDLIYLKKNGYTTIVMQDLLDYVDKKSPLPPKPILLTFDDGYYNNYLYAYPLIKKYNAKIVISPIGYYTDLFSESNPDHPNYSHCTWDEINEMMDSGLVEFQNHTYNLHASKGVRVGAGKLKRESTASYAEVLSQDLGRLQQEMKENTGYSPTTFVYPFGVVSDESISIIKNLGFRASMTCMAKMNYITTDPQCLYKLGRYLRPMGASSDRYFRGIGLN